MAVKIVIFDLFETLISEFDAGHPSTTEVAQTLGLPVCAAWFLRQHTDLLGDDIVMRRAAGYPVLAHPSELVDRMRDIIIRKSE